MFAGRLAHRDTAPVSTSQETQANSMELVTFEFDSLGVEEVSHRSGGDFVTTYFT